MHSFGKILKISKYTACAVLFSLALSGCTILPKKKAAQADPDLNRIVVWGFDDEDIWKPIKRDFEGQNKGYTLDYKRQVFDGNYENRFLNSILSTQKPDILAMPNDWVYRHKEKLAPMPAGMMKNFNIDDIFVKSIKQSVFFDNQVYALSPASEPLMVYYNPNLFDQTRTKLTENVAETEDRRRFDELLTEPPKTWTDFVEAAKLLTQKDGSKIDVSGIAMGTDKINNSQDIVYLLMMQNETQVFSENLKVATFNLPTKVPSGKDDIPGKRALEFYTSFANPGSPNYTWNDSLGSDVEAFANGKAVMIFGYSNLQNYLLQKYPGASFQYRKAFMPQVSQDNSKIVDFARFNVFGVSALSKNPAAAWSIVRQISTDQADTFNSANRLFTAQKASNYDISINNRTTGNPEQLALVTANSLVKGRYPAEIDNIVRQAISAVNKGVQDSKSALDLASNNATELLRKEEW